MSHDAVMPKHPKRPRDPSQLAKLVVDIAVGDANDSPSQLFPDNQADQSVIGSPGGRIGGKARAAALTPARRRDIARLAASSRWQKDKSK
jgi:hypothetical protein